jgi:hypothetical protein
MHTIGALVVRGLGVIGWLVWVAGYRGDDNDREVRNFAG